MDKLKNFLDMITGQFDNSEQFNKLEGEEAKKFPFAKHINTICNDKINNLPENFDGVFFLEESYYTTNGKKHAAPHLFLFTEKEDGIQLDSYEIPEGYNNDSFTYDNLNPVDYSELKKSEKFTPAIYKLKDNVWEGGSVSNFSPVVTFTLFERFSPEVLEVTESMEVNGKRTFGFDAPILYKRIVK